MLSCGDDELRRAHREAVPPVVEFPPTTKSRSMDEKEVRDLPGPPDEIVSRAERMRARMWQCSHCGEIVLSAEPVTNPAPCKRCGGIAFRIPRSEN